MTIPDDNVVRVDPREHRLIWVCACGCTVHRAYADGKLECAECDMIAEASKAPRWRERLPDAPEDVEPMAPDAFKVVMLDTVTTFVKRRMADGDIEKAAIVAFVYEDGSMATFSTRFAEEQAAWAREQMAIVTERVAKVRE